MKVEVLEKIEVKYLDFMFQRKISRIWYKHTFYQCCGSRMFIPDPGSEFFHPGSRVKKDSGSRIRIRKKELKYF
jgi:hypothetical protein